MSEEAHFEAMVDALKLAVATLREADIRFALGGSSAAWARGAPRPQKDLDLMLRPQDADAALAALEHAGMRPERPPEEWLYKAWCGEILIDLIFSPAGLPMTDDVLDRAEVLAVMSIAVPVMAIEDVLLTKLNALQEHSLDYTALLGIARALREQIDWPSLQSRAGQSPYAQAFFTLVRGLDIAPAPDGSPPASGTRVRVISGSGG